MSPRPQQDAYWVLVEQLMQRGWYRAGAGPRQEDDRLVWGFREGHLRDVGHCETLWVAAPDEVTAMRLLFTELRAREAANSPSTVPGISLEAAAAAEGANQPGLGLFRQT
jgi:hypothetical protein